MKRFLFLIAFILIGFTVKAQYKGLWFEGSQYYKLGDSTVTVWGSDTLTNPAMVRQIIEDAEINSDSALYADTSDYSNTSGNADTAAFASSYEKDSTYSVLTATDSLIIGTIPIKADTDTINSERFWARFKGLFARTIKVENIETDSLIMGSDTTIGFAGLKVSIEAENFDSITIVNTIRWNASEGVHEFVTGIDDVVWQGALEDLVQVYNNTGSTIENGTPFFLSLADGDTITTIGIASAYTPTSIAFAGAITGEIANGEWGFGCTRGKVRGLNTSSLSLFGAMFLGDSVFTMAKPDVTGEVIVAGGVISVHASEGIIYIQPSLALKRELETRDYSFTTQGILSGTYYKGGFYDFPATDANLTQALTTQIYGTANIAYSAHGSIVCGGAGSVDAGVVGLRVTGTSITDEGVRTTTDADTLITDITAVVVDEYYESKKWVGQVTFELITISGSPTTYSLDFNYGFAKYEDANNSDYYITGLEVVGLAGANDAGFNIELLHHKATGWTYAASGFVPGDGSIASWATDLGTEDDLSSGENFSWKRSNLSQFINGDDGEGAIYRITTGASASVQSMDLHILIVLD